MPLNIAALRLQNQRLVDAPFKKPVDVLRWLGAVQAQDYPGGKWALGLRMQNATDAAIDAAFNAGTLVRTHMLRPTWHLVAPQDLRWMLELTSPRVHVANRSVYRMCDLDAPLLSRARKIFIKALEGGRSLTRAELCELLEGKRIPARSTRLAYIVMHAELEGVICSGPIRGKQHTYALVDERVPPAPRMQKEEALAELARRYFVSHGPATANDFAWWSGLTVAEGRRAAQMAGAALHAVEFNGKTYWMAADLLDVAVKKPAVHLLPNYDEHVVAYRDHGPSIDPATPKVLNGWGSGLTAHLVTRNGLVIGGWRRDVRKDDVAIRLDVPIPLAPREKSSLQRAIARYRDFIGKPVVIAGAAR